MFQACLAARRAGRIAGRLLLTSALAGATLLSGASVAAAQSGPAPVWKHFPAPPKAPASAPNILLIMTDDVGFSAASAFGGPTPTPTFDRLAARGLRYTEFHTTAMCSPTRAALLTGRNHHAVSSGSISNVALDEAGYTSVIPDSAASIGRVLRDQGYSTAWFGKNHNTPDWETGPLGPYERWPIGMGFDYFYGFNLAMTDQISPTLTENMNPVRRPEGPDYFLDRDLSDHMIKWLRLQHTLAADKPFFAYLAPGTTHSPLQAPKAWIDKFKGQFDQGWDRLREETFARQKRMGIIPRNAKLAGRPPGIPAWSSLSADEKRVYARTMEVAAGMLAYSDHQIGRVIDELERTGQLDNTLVIFIQGDNGGSPEKLNGTWNTNLAFAGVKETAADLLPRIDELGGENSQGQYPAGWGWATNAPFPWGKQVASHLGGLRDGMVMSWPARIKQQGQIRTQFHHVIDIAPTIYAAAGITPPESVGGAKQQRIDGVSMVYTFDDAKAPSHRREQYFEMLGNRSYYKDGWFASTTPVFGPWEGKNTPVDPMSFKWELYDLNTDYSQTRNLAAKYPAKLAELQAAFDVAARANNVYPMTANLYGRMDRTLRPNTVSAKGSAAYYPGDARYPSLATPAFGAGWRGEAVVKVASDGANGPIFNFGSRFSGMALSLKDGAPRFVYDPTGREEERRVLQSKTALTPGASSTLTVAFTADSVSLSVNGAEVDRGPVAKLLQPRGDLHVGRRAIDDHSGPEACDCAIERVMLEAR